MLKIYLIIFIISINGTNSINWNKYIQNTLLECNGQKVYSLEGLENYNFLTDIYLNWNKIKRINEYYIITNSTDYTHHNINSNNNITSNSNNSLASKIILTTLNTTSNKPVEQYVQRTIKSAAPQLVQYTDYQDLLRNSSNNSVDNEFQISFFR